MKRTLTFVLLSMCTLLALPAQALPKKVATVEGITEYQLPNGLRVLLFPDASKPTVTVNVTYLVGSRHEGYGETGMAHLLEHMMFKGSKKYPKVLGLLEQRGARLNGTTWVDRTNYFETLPAEKDNLDFALSLEADRMVNATISGDDLKSEFSVVRNEFEINENEPSTVLEERMLESAYLWHNYGKPTIGARSDIERVPVDNLRAFYKRYYQPDNAVLVVAGKIDPQKTLTLVEKTFGKIPRPTRKLPATYTVEPVQDGERAVTLRRTGDVQVVGLLYHALPGAHPDFAAETAMLGILDDEPSGRLYKALVDSGLAAKVRSQAYPTAEPGVVEVFADVRKDKPLDKVRDKMIEVVEGLAKSPVGKDELERWRSKTLRDIDLGLTNSERIGVELSEWLAQGDWRLMFIYRDRVKAVTAADVQRVAGEYLKQSNRTVGLFVPTAKPDRAPLPEQPDTQKMVASYHGNDSVSDGEQFVATVDNIEKRTSRTTLPSGMKLALLPKKTRGGAVEIALTVHFGNEKDLKGQQGVASLMREMVLRGTKKHTYEQIQDQLSQLKAELKPDFNGLSGGGADTSAVFWVTTVKESVPKVLSLLGEIVREPSFPSDQLENVRKARLAMLEEQLHQPMAAGFVTLMQRAHPFPKDDVRYVPSFAEQIERIKTVHAEDLSRFHQQFWGGEGTTLVMVGDFDAAEVQSDVQKSFGNWKAPKPWQRLSMPYRAAKPTDETIRTPDKQMAFVGAVEPLALRDDDPEYPAMRLADYVYGGGARSRIWERLREKEGLSYGTFSFLNANAFDKSAIFLAAAMCAPQNAAKAMTGLVEEISKLLDQGVAEKELAEQKKSFEAQFEQQLSNDESLTMLLDKTLYTGRTLRFEEQVNAKVQSLTASQVVSTMKKWLDPSQLVKVKIGDLKD